MRRVDMNLPGGRVKRIHVNKHVMRANKGKPTSEREPVFTVKTSSANHRSHAVRIDGPSMLEYDPDKPLSCGAEAWLTTFGPVHLLVDEEVSGE